MGSKLINNTLSSLSAGVTQQYQEGRFDSQVSEMVNCIPSITRGILRRNPLNSVANLSELPTDLSGAFVYTYDRGTGNEQYMVIIPGNGYIYVYNVDGTHLHTSTYNTYLVAALGYTAKNTFKTITIADHTFILNTKTTTSFTTATSSTAGYSNMAFYWIKKTASVVTKEKSQDSFFNTNAGYRTLGYTYNLNDKEVKGYAETRPGYTEAHLDTSELIASEFRKYSSTSKAPYSKDSVCYTLNFTGTSWDWTDSFGDEASLGVWKTLDSSDKLPYSLPEALDGFIVKISGGTSQEFDDYYLQYSFLDKAWTEIASPGSLTTLDSTTMPHVLYRMADGGFCFDTYKEVLDGDNSTTGPTGVSMWGQREAGGDDTIDDPSFIGKSINSIFFHRNRMGLITDDSIVLSRTSDYGHFFIQTLQAVLDDDPIDLAVASQDVTILRHAVPTAGTLILFSDDTQFALTSSADGPLTPSSATIIALSNYTYGSKADAVAIGNRILFSNQAGGYSQIYSYSIRDIINQYTEASPMTIHLPSYIDKSVSRIIGHDVLGYTFIEEEDNPTELVILTNVTRGKEELQNAFHKWKFSDNILSTHIINNDLYILFTTGDLTRMSLEVPGKITDVEYIDTYTSRGTVGYTSYINFSEFFYRDKEGKGTVRGRYQLRTFKYTIDENSKYVTSIVSTDQFVLLNEDDYLYKIWYDTETWEDTLVWLDTDLAYTREYINDDKVTLMANSKKVEIVFSSSKEEPTKGFELSTVNIEALFTQRSTRT